MPGKRSAYELWALELLFADGFAPMTRNGAADPSRGGAFVLKPEFAFAADPALVRFGASFVKSDAFKAMFREGMALVEDTAEYLDGPGRTESTALRRNAALTYASESMRLTTRLMQIASWLLVQRAVAEGEISAAQAQREKDRVRLASQDGSGAARDYDEMPERFRELVSLSLRLHARVVHLDSLIAEAEEGPRPRASSPVSIQQDLLMMAFGARRAAG
jgi:regulator of CtrA degradation